MQNGKALLSYKKRLNGKKRKNECAFTKSLLLFSIKKLYLIIPS
jgi:hypothetical protein